MNRAHALSAVGCVALASSLSTTVLAQGDPATAQPQPTLVPQAQAPIIPVLPSSRFDKLRDDTIKNRKALFEEVSASWSRPSARVGAHASNFKKGVPFPSARLQAPSIDRASAATAIELATAALRTSIDGAEAGLSVAPLALAGLDQSPSQINLTLAALEDSKTEIGVGYVYQEGWNPLTPMDIGLPACEFDAKREKALREAIEALRFSLEDACQAMNEIDAIPNIGTSAARSEALGVCRGTDNSAMEMGHLMALIQKSVTDARASAARIEAGRRLHRVESSFLALDKFLEAKLPAPDCYTDKQFDEAAVRAGYEARRLRAGVGGHVDLFPWTFGYNPDPNKKLSAGEVSRWVLNIEGAWVTGVFEARLGFGFGRSRADLEESLRSFIAPSVSLASTVASLSGEPLYKKDEDGERKLNVVNGALPPRLVIGLDGQMEYALQRADTQRTSIQKVVVTAFADFRISDKLGFRLGAPLTGELVTREASTDPPVTEETDIQWSIPVSVTTILKL